MFQKMSNPHNDPAAHEAVEKANAAIDAYQAETSAIASDSAALVESAMQAAPDDAARLVKGLEALRLRRIRNLLVALQVPAVKVAACAAIRSAAAEEVKVKTEALENQEGVIREAAEVLGYATGSRQRIQLFNADPIRRDLTLAVSDARSRCSFSAACDEDAAEVDEVKRQLAALLK